MARADSLTDTAAPATPAKPPVAPKKYGYRVRDIHTDHFDDGWDWLRDETNPEVITHLDAENQWADKVCAASSSLARRIVDDIRERTALTDASVPVRDGDYWYFTRWAEGASYATHHRVAADPRAALDAPPPLPAPGIALPGEQLLVDENAEAAGREFFRLAELVPSPDGQLIAWARDTTGDERYTWIVQDAATGQVIDQAVSDAGYGFAWAADSRSFIYMGLDEAWRSCEVWWHEVGADYTNDRLLLVSSDERFEMGINAAGDPNLVVIHAASTTCGQAWLWLPAAPTGRPIPVTGVTEGVMVTVDSAGDHLVLVHTATTQEGSLAAAALPEDLATRVLRAGPERSREALAGREAGADLTGQAAGADSPAPFAPPATWVSLREPGPGERIVDVEAYADFLALSLRSGSLTQVEYRVRVARTKDSPAKTDTVVAADLAAEAVTCANTHVMSEIVESEPRLCLISRVEQSDLANQWGPGEFVETQSRVRTIYTTAGSRFHDPTFRVEVQSQTTAPTTIQIDPVTGSRTILKVQAAPGWDSDAFVEERVWVTARDGHTQIPVTLIHRADVQPNGTNPGWQIGYGSYEISYDPEFETLKLPVLERGVVYAIAHIRGGGEMGRAWYEDGKMLVKEHTFTDFIDVADWLVSSGWVAPGRLVAEGRSAGGLLMGNIINNAPDRFAAVLAGVPFVDALTTILDASLPLTVGEWEEWGNPIEDEQVFAVMKRYTPYENVPEDVRLPAIMATTSVNDTRVEFVEPTKWVQRLREASGQNSADWRDNPIILRTEMVAGHGGPSGREGRWASRAEEFAFALAQVGVTD